VNRESLTHIPAVYLFFANTTLGAPLLHRLSIFSPKSPMSQRKNWVQAFVQRFNIFPAVNTRFSRTSLPKFLQHGPIVVDESKAGFR
jgi:hypothetical protein